MKKAGILFLSLLLIGVISLKAQTTRLPYEQIMDNDERPDTKALVTQVTSMYAFAWDAYKRCAWGYDDVRPISRTSHNWYSRSLLMTPIDALDGMILMGLTKQKEEAEKLIFDRLKFDVDMEVQNFEVSIRVLGGLLSAYELEKDHRFLDMAKDLGDRLIKSFDSPTGMPYRYVNLATGKTRGEISNPAEIGTYIIEYGILSRHTGDPKYFDIAKRAMMNLYSRRSPIGLIGSSINVETGEWTSTSSHISGGIDSFYEYALKASILFNDAELHEMWQSSLEGINKFMKDTRFNGTWYGHVDMNDGQIKKTAYGSLDAFFAASLAMAGDIETARELQESNFKMWMTFGIEPEQLDYSTMKPIYPSYELRPENFESAYYLYQYTHDKRYLKMGDLMFRNLIQYCMDEVGFCALADVTTKEKKDEMESFFFAETLKYAFLLFDEGRTFNFNEVIFNTEAHPYKRSAH